MDCRDEYDKSVADIIALEKYLVKVNPVEAWICHVLGGPGWIGEISSMVTIQKSFTFEKIKSQLRKKKRSHFLVWQFFLDVLYEKDICKNDWQVSGISKPPVVRSDSLRDIYIYIYKYVFALFKRAW